MKIPKKLKIGGHLVTIKLVDKLESDGEFDPNENVIYISKKLSQTQKEETLIHEIMGYQNPSFHGDNHGLLQAISHSIYQVLRENKLI